MPDQEVKPREISDDELLWMGKKLEQEAVAAMVLLLRQRARPRPLQPI